MKLATYSRVSTDQQKVGMEVYRQSVKNFSIRNEHDVILTFEDEDVSGGISLKDRPSGSKLYEAAMSRKIEGILADNVSRMFRDMEDGICMANRFREAGIKVFFSDFGAQPIDIETESGFLWFVMQLAMAHMERMKIRKRTKDSHAMRRKLNLATSHAPYGMDKTEDNRLVVNDTEMEVVNRMIEYRDGQGFSFQAIADLFNAEGTCSKRGGLWDKKAISNTIKYYAK
jgi:DNA invertase Pin-like site-specific DNA recombinase